MILMALGAILFIVGMFIQNEFLVIIGAISFATGWAIVQDKE